MLQTHLIPALEDNYIFVLHETNSQETVVVDPSEAKPVLDFLQEKNWPLTTIWNTHHHPDHTNGNLELKQKTSCTILGPRDGLGKIPGRDQELSENDCILLGAKEVHIFETPGHTSEAVCYFIKDDKVLFCGDSLFSLGCGRLFEGTAKDLWTSLEKIKKLPKETVIYCAHEYTLQNSLFALSLEPENTDLIDYKKNIEEKRKQNKATIPSTLEKELKTNPFLRANVKSLQKKISMEGSEEWLVFKKLRELKDNFS